MFNVQVNLPDDMSEIINRIVDFQTNKLMNECSNKEIEAVIDYLENNNSKTDS